MAEDLSKLSSADIRRFEKTVSDAKALTARQEEIAKRVLATEKDIGKVRLAALNKYFDAYSKGLDEVIARKTSQLDDAFLVMEQRALKRFKRAAESELNLKSAAESSISNTPAKQRTQAKQKDDTVKQNTGAGQNTRQLHEDKPVVVQVTANTKSDTSANDVQREPYEQESFLETTINKAVDRLISAISASAGGGQDLTQNTYTDTTQEPVEEKPADDGGTPPPTEPPDIDSTDGPSEPPPPDESVDVYQTKSDADTAKLGEEASTAKDIVDRLLDFSAKNKTVQEQLNAMTDAREEQQKEAVISLIQLEAARNENRKKHSKEYAESELSLEQKLTELTLARMQADDQYASKEDRINKLKELQIKNIGEVVEAELEAQRLINDIEAERIYASEESAEGKNYNKEKGELQARKASAEDTKASVLQIEEARLAFIAKKELESKRKHNGVLLADEAAKIQKLAVEKFKIDEKNLEKITKKRLDHEATEAKREQYTKTIENLNSLTKGSIQERKEAFYNITHDESGNIDGKQIASTIATATVKAVDKGISALSDFAKKLNTTVDEIGSYKSLIDTRLHGSSNNTYNDSYWDQIVKDMTSLGAVNPFFKQSDFAANIKSLVDEGIAFDLEQRAFLMTIQSKIANTFEVADGTLLKLIRIQQEDTTAGRLGMEAALNAFLNNMHENTEYLKKVADSVRGSLEEMQSLMDGAEAVEVEYQVQKWLGSMYSVGMSETAVKSISDALGQIAAGQIDGLINGGAGNLLVMAANEAGLSIADILTEGISADNTNKLMQAVVDYLAQIAESSNNNKVTQQQLAEVFGVKASDLRAATNLVSKNSVSAIYNSAINGSSSSYTDMVEYLSTMVSTMGDRTSLSEKMTNIWDNVQYSIAGSMANNPVTYLLYKVANVLDDTTGGIAIPAVSVLGNMVDLETTVADLMRVGAMAGGILGSLDDLMSGLSNSFDGQLMLNQLGISSGAGIAVTPRGTGNVDRQTSSGSSTSGSGYVAGNGSSDDIKNSTMQQATDTKKQLMVEAQEEAEGNELNVLNTTVLKIYELLDDVAHGNSCFRVKVDNYGLTKTSNALGGVSGLNGTTTSANSSTAITGVNSSSLSGSMNTGVWTTTL